MKTKTDAETLEVIQILVAATREGRLGWERALVHYSDGSQAYTTAFGDYRLRFRSGNNYIHGNGFSFTADPSDLDALTEAIAMQHDTQAASTKPKFIDALKRSLGAS